MPGWRSRGVAEPVSRGRLQCMFQRPCLRRGRAFFCTTRTRLPVSTPSITRASQRTTAQVQLLKRREVLHRSVFTVAWVNSAKISDGFSLDWPSLFAASPTSASCSCLYPSCRLYRPWIVPFENEAMFDFSTMPIMWLARRIAKHGAQMPGRVDSASWPETASSGREHRAAFSDESGDKR